MADWWCNTRDPAARPTARGDDVKRIAQLEWAAADAEDVAVPAIVAALMPELPPLLRSVHTVGAADTMNPPDQAMRLAAAFGPGAQLLEHKVGWCRLTPSSPRLLVSALETNMS